MQSNFDYLKCLSQAVAVITVNGDIDYLNLKAQELFGVILNAKRLNLLELIGNVKLMACKDVIKDVLMTVYHSNQKKDLILKNDNHHEFHFHFIRSEERIVVEIISQGIISKKDIFDFVVTNSPDMISFKGEDFSYQFVNDTCLQILNIKEEDIIGYTDEDLMEKGLLPPILYHQIVQGDTETLEMGEYSSIEFSSNQNYYEVLKKRFRNGIFCIARDVTNEISISQQSEIDVTTSLYNRKAMNRMLNSIPKEKKYHAVEIILENFGELLKKYDLQYANRCLKQLGHSLKDYPDALFFHLDGIGFVGLFDKKLRDSDKVRESIVNQISNINLPPLLKIEVTMKMIDDQYNLFSICE